MSSPAGTRSFSSSGRRPPSVSVGDQTGRSGAGSPSSRRQPDAGGAPARGAEHGRRAVGRRRCLVARTPQHHARRRREAPSRARTARAAPRPSLVADRRPTTDVAGRFARRRDGPPILPPAIGRLQTHSGESRARRPRRPPGSRSYAAASAAHGLHVARRASCWVRRPPPEFGERWRQLFIAPADVVAPNVGGCWFTVLRPTSLTAPAQPTLTHRHARGTQGLR